MGKKLQIALLLFLLSFSVYLFCQFSGFQGYEDETYNRIVKNLETGEFKTARSGYAQTLLETPFVLKGQIMGSILGVDHAKISQLYALFYNPFVTALSVAIIFLIFVLYVGKRRAFWLSLIYAFGTMAFPYASIGMEPTAVLFILLSVYFLFLSGRNVPWHIPTKYYLALSGLFYFLLFFSKAYYFVTGLAFIAYLYLLDSSSVKKFIKHVLLFFLPLVAIIPVYLLANKYNFGVYFGGQYKLSNELFGGENPIFGIYGLLLSFGKSIFIYVPVLILSVIFFPRFYRKYPKEAIFVLIYSFSLITFISQIHWWSDETWGPRYLLSLSAIGLLPLITLPFATPVLSFRPLSRDPERLLGKKRLNPRVSQGSPEDDNRERVSISKNRIKVLAFGLILTASFFFQLLGSLVRYDVFPYSFYEIYGTTGYNVLASQEYQYIPQFAPYFVNYQLIKNKFFGRNKPLDYKIIYSPPMEMAATERGKEVTKKITYDNNKYQAHAINFWWMNLPGVPAYKLLGIFVLIFAGLISFAIHLSSSSSTRGSKE